MNDLDQYYLEKCAEALNDLERMITDECQKICAKIERHCREDHEPARPPLRVIRGGRK